MYADNTLTPREAIRLCALGTLAESSTSNETAITYDDLARSIRHFISRITGPSIDLMGESIELLRFEGLIEAKDNTNPSNPTLEITKEGTKLLQELLLTNIRPGSGDLNELIIALKFRFLHHISPNQQLSQIDLMLEVYESELLRNEDLCNYHKHDKGYFIGWLKNNIARLEIRNNWLKTFKRNITEKHQL
mgnify:CR=1 FL=1